MYSFFGFPRFDAVSGDVVDIALIPVKFHKIVYIQL
jgi:hypothetical protein